MFGQPMTAAERMRRHRALDGGVSEVSPVATLGWIARAKAIASKSDQEAAQAWLEAVRCPEDIRRVYKAAVGAGTSADLGIPVSAWVDALARRSVFYRLMSDNALQRLPVRSRAGLAAVSGAGSVVGEGMATPLRELVLSNDLLEELKVQCMIICSDAMLADPSTQAAFNRALMNKMAAAVDGAFLDLLMSSGTPSAPSAGVTAADAHHDLRTALLTMTSTDEDRLYWILGIEAAKRASSLADAAGSTAFADMSSAGGSLLGQPALVSAGVTTDALYLVNGAAIVADAGSPSIDTSTQADIQMNDAPTMNGITPTPASLVSLFQSDLTAIRCTAWVAARALGEADAVVEVTSIGWGG